MYDQPRRPAREDREERQQRTEPGRQQQDMPSALSIEELAETANVPVRTIRYYIAEGLLPGPGSRGKLATYGEEHLARLRLIRRLVERRVPLAELRERVALLTLGEVVLLLREEDQLAEERQQVEQSASPREYVSGLLKRARAARDRDQTAASPYAPPARAPRPSTGSGPLAPGAKGGRFPPALGPHAGEAWQRWELVPGVELHVRTDAEWRYRELIRRLLAETQAFEKER
jgi:DNA-binding transcriptional MerR regulator